MGIIQKHLRRVLPRTWEKVLEDPRRCEVRWGFSELIDTLMHGFIGGCKHLRELEMLTATSGRRVPDTTLHDFVVQLETEPLEEELAHQVKQANRSHELDNKELPVRLTVIDGKNLSTTSEPVDEYSINRSQKGCRKYVQHALRAFHASSTVKLHMAQQRVPKGSSEKSMFPHLLEKLVEFYGNTNLLEVFSLDAGFLSGANAQTIVDHGYYYIFALKNAYMYPITRVAIELLSSQTAPCEVAKERVNGNEIVRSLYRCPAPEVNKWSHATQLWRIHKVTVNVKTGKTTSENFYSATNLPWNKLSNAQILKADRLHWGIENNANWVMDTAWKEDTRPFCNEGLEPISLMRLIAYNVAARFKLRRLKRTTAKMWTWEQTLSFIKVVLFPFDERKAFATL